MRLTALLGADLDEMEDLTSVTETYSSSMLKCFLALLTCKLYIYTKSVQMLGFQLSVSQSVQHTEHAE